MKFPLSRRDFVLKGLGTAIALPWLEAMGGLSSVVSAAAKAPKRLAVLYVPNGICMESWTPSAEGETFKLPLILEPLEPFKKDFSILTGLDQEFGDAEMPGDHARAASIFLTGCRIQKSGGFHAGISLDQVAARAIGKQTRFPSLELGCDPSRQAGECNAGYSCAYTTTISWQTEHVPLPKESNPKAVFERLFAGPNHKEAQQVRAVRLQQEKSVLDYVLDQSKRLKTSLGRADQVKVDEYESALRQLERRIYDPQWEHATEIPDAVANRYLTLPENYNYRQQMRLLLDLMVIAFQSDTTRVGTFMLSDEFSNRSYDMIGISEGHHDLSHHQGLERNLQKLRKINRFHVEQLAYFLGRLESVKEENGSLLDNSSILYGSGLSDGNGHSHKNLPVILAGRGGGSHRPGRHLRFPKGTPLNNLHCTLLQGLGAPVERLGNSTGTLPEIA